MLKNALFTGVCGVLLHVFTNELFDFLSIVSVAFSLCDAQTMYVVLPILCSVFVTGV